MQIVSTGDNLHEMLNPVGWEKFEKHHQNLSSTELAQRVIKVNRNEYTIKGNNPAIKIFTSLLVWGFYLRKEFVSPFHLIVSPGFQVPSIEKVGIK